MNKELEVLALSGDEDALKTLKEMASQRGEKLIIMQRHLQVHFYSQDGVKWYRDTIIWSSWHQVSSNEPSYYIDAEREGKAFRTVKTERQITYVDSKLLDPEEIPLLLEKRQELRKSLTKLQEMLNEAIKEEKYEDAAKIRDEIDFRRTSASRPATWKEAIDCHTEKELYDSEDGDCCEKAGMKNE